MPESSIGKVYLVGAGPGDPRLITQHGLQCLMSADLVLYDGLVNPLILRWTRGDVEKTARIKRPGEMTVHQEEINRRLVDEARAGKTVVRLKGGDPFIFGRGGEEAEALANAGIPFEVIPGITAATAAGVYSGITLTHREFASQVMFITGHENPDKETRLIDDQLLAKFQGTIVVYMGLHRFDELIERLLTAGKSPQTPIAIVSRASWPQQKTMEGTLATIVDQVSQAHLSPPSLTIIGECVSRRKLIDWFESKPLFGLNIGLTRALHQAEPQIEQLLDLGANPVLMPIIDIAPPEDWTDVDTAIAYLGDVDWIVFTSSNGVDALMQRVWETGLDLRAFFDVKIACIGTSTAETLTRYHLRADLVPDEYSSEGLAEKLLEETEEGDVILWPRANRGREVLTNRLREAGRQVHEIVVYHHVDADSFPAETIKLIESEELHWVGLSSPAIARHYAHLMQNTAFEGKRESVRIVAISEITAGAARESGLTVHAVAESATWEAMFASIQRAHSGTSEAPET